MEVACVTLAPESRHIVAFFLSSTTYRAADSHLESLLVEYGLGGLVSPGVAMDSAQVCQELVCQELVRHGLD